MCLETRRRRVQLGESSERVRGEANEGRRQPLTPERSGHKGKQPIPRGWPRTVFSGLPSPVPTDQRVDVSGDWEEGVCERRACGGRGGVEKSDNFRFNSSVTANPASQNPDSATHMCSSETRVDGRLSLTRLRDCAPLRATSTEHGLTHRTACSGAPCLQEAAGEDGGSSVSGQARRALSRLRSDRPCLCREPRSLPGAAPRTCLLVGVSFSSGDFELNVNRL